MNFRCISWQNSVLSLKQWKINWPIKTQLLRGRWGGLWFEKVRGFTLNQQKLMAAKESREEVYLGVYKHCPALIKGGHLD